MKDSVLKLTLDEDLNVKYEAGANILNQQSASRQYIEVTLKGFALAEDERLYVAFTYAGGKNITTAYIYLPCEEGIYRTEIPYDVYSLRGRWKGNFAVKSDWVTATDADGYPLLDEDGNEIEFEILFSFEHKDQEYAVLSELEAVESEEGPSDAYILKIVENDGEEEFVAVEDDLLEELTQVVEEILQEELSEAEEEE